MDMLPINRIVNCNRILDTGTYQLHDLGSQYKGIEDIWLIKYFIDQGKSKSDIYELIKPIHEKYHGYLGERTFSIYFDRAKKCNINKYSNKITFYDGEIQAINHLNIPLFQKQFALCVLAFFKANEKNIFTYDDFMCCGIKQLVKRSDRHEKSDFSISIIEMEKYGLLKRVVLRNANDGSVFKVEYNKKQFAKGNIVLELETIADIVDHYDIIKNMQVCDICGIEFEKAPRCKRTICEECWKKQRRTSKTTLQRKYRMCGQEIHILHNG